MVYNLLSGSNDPANADIFLSTASKGSLTKMAPVPMRIDVYSSAGYALLFEGSYAKTLFTSILITLSFLLNSINFAILASFSRMGCQQWWINEYKLSRGYTPAYFYLYISRSDVSTSLIF